MSIDQILYNAILADHDLMQTIGGRIRSTCFEVGTDLQDNTPLPCIVIIDEGRQAQPETKDSLWKPLDWHVSASIEVSAKEPREVDTIIARCVRAVAAYVETLDYSDTPQLDTIQTDGKAWDWTKPCYYDRLRYQCTIYNQE